MAWDGFVSQWRAYNPGEMIELADGLDVGYSWRAGRIPIGRNAGYWTYLIGTPQTLASEDRELTGPQVPNCPPTKEQQVGTPGQIHSA
jgi:hypothetical protein